MFLKQCILQRYVLKWDLILDNIPGEKTLIPLHIKIKNPTKHQLGNKMRNQHCLAYPFVSKGVKINLKRTDLYS